MPPDEGIGLFNSYRPNFCSTVVNALSIPATISSMSASVAIRAGQRVRVLLFCVVEFAEGARGLADEHASLLGGTDHRVGDGFSNGFLRGAILHDFDTGEQALAANVADDGMLRHQALEAFEEAVAHLRAVFEQVFTFDDFDVGQSRGGTGGAAAEGGDVAEVGVGIGRVVDEVLEDLFGRHDG